MWKAGGQKLVQNVSFGEITWKWEKQKNLQGGKFW